MQNDDHVKIVPANSVHLDRIVEIEELCFPCPWKWEFFAQELQYPNRYHRVLISNGCLAGYLFSYYVHPEIHISKIAVHPDYQNRQYATRMMDQFSSFCRLKKITDISLEVRTTNTAAIQFYKNWNLSVVGVRKRYYDDGEDAYIMVGHW